MQNKSIQAFIKLLTPEETNCFILASVKGEVRREIRKIAEKSVPGSHIPEVSPRRTNALLT